MIDKTIKKIQARKKLMGKIISVLNEKTLKVRVERKMTHPLYKKIIKSHKKYLVENDIPGLKVGNNVLIEECSPKSRSKNFKILKKV